MRGEFTVIIEKGERFFVGYCLEVRGANGHGATIDECRESVRGAIRLILQDRLEDGLRGVPPDAVRATVVVE